MRIFVSLLASLLFVSCSTMPKQPPLKTVPHVDLERFMGAWYVIGVIPWVVEKDNVGTMDIYEMRKDGKIAIRYVFHKKTLSAPAQEWKATARVVNKTTNSEWAVQFIWPFEAPYLVIGLSKDYETTVIGHPSRKLLWIMSRKPVMAEAEYEKILREVAEQGYDPKAVVKVPQKTDK